MPVFEAVFSHCTFTLHDCPSRNFVIQSEVKLNPILTVSYSFSRASHQLHVYLLQVLIGSLYRPCLLWLARMINLVSVLRRCIENSLHLLNIEVLNSLEIPGYRFDGTSASRSSSVARHQMRSLCKQASIKCSTQTKMKSSKTMKIL